VEGVGRKRIGAISGAWKQQREIRAVMIFLQSYGVGTALAAKIYQRYGDHAIAPVRENPYRLAMEVTGIGFLTADRMAQRLSLPPESPAVGVRKALAMALKNADTQERYTGLRARLAALAASG
jgi:exodeoxyribonuclease V alpha subunit